MSAASRHAGLLVAFFAGPLMGCSEGGQPRHVVPDGDADRGKRLIGAYGCGACHVVPGVAGARGTVGPPLTDFGLRAYIAGAVANEPENLIRWIRDPRVIEPGTVMPPVGATAADARDIAAYLYTLGADRALGPPRLVPVDALDPLRGGGP